MLGKLVRYNEKARGFAEAMGLTNTIGIVIGERCDAQAGMRYSDFIRILWFTDKKRILDVKNMMFLTRNSEGMEMLEILA